MNTMTRSALHIVVLFAMLPCAHPRAEHRYEVVAKNYYGYPYRSTRLAVCFASGEPTSMLGAERLKAAGARESYSEFVTATILKYLRKGTSFLDVQTIQSSYPVDSVRLTVGKTDAHTFPIPDSTTNQS
jgi:hypothetical protein